MLIINADDYGKNRGTTDHILHCFNNGRITSATAMMFMEDTERSAELAKECGLDVGLHLNLSDRFTGNHHGSGLDDSHARVSRFMSQHSLSLVLYNPRLARDFEYTFRSQWERFIELYGKPPTHVDGHRHKHLSVNTLLGNIIPSGIKLRRNFHFASGEKGMANRVYRAFIDWYLARKYVCADYFFSIQPLQNRERIRKIAELSRKANVEMMVHPEVESELNFLMSKEYTDILEGVDKGSYSMLPPSTRYAKQI